MDALRMHTRVWPICVFVVLLCIAVLPRQGASSDGLGGNASVTSSVYSGVAKSESLDNDNLPPSGVSLFDRIFSRQTSNGFEYDVPYPFEKVLQRITAYQSGSHDRNKLSVVEVLIPIGRSLQREAARPDFFRYPRVLLAVDTESQHRVLTRDRLFVGYQEKAGIIEVISYNESAGRFEFQVVKDYAFGTTPKVRYANRALCMSCHQNAATIFPRGQWQETNFNMQVAQKIKDHHAVYHGVPANGSAGNAGRFDAATDRANLFAAYQQVWNRGCGSDSSRDAGKSCRAQLFLELLRYRLASVSQPVYRPPQYLSPVLQDNWQQLWPDGLPIPQADLKDRPPPLSTLDNSLSQQQDPLTLRPPFAHWSYLRAAHQTIQGLSEGFLLDRDVGLLNDHLYGLTSTRDVPDKEYEGACQFGLEHGDATESWLSVDCSLNNNEEGSSFSLLGELHIRAGGWLSKEMSWLYISNGTRSVRASVAGRIGDTDTQLSLRLFKPYHSVYSRLWDDRLISHFEIHFEQELALQRTVDDKHISGNASLRISNDLPVLEQAVSSLLRNSRQGNFTGFNSTPFQGIRLMDALFLELGVTAADKNVVPIPVGLKMFVDQNESASDLTSLSGQVVQTEALRTFVRYCSACHAGDTTLPPAFLAGSIEQVKVSLRSCAPRIAFRLGMWALADDRRPKPPMPPLGYLHNASIDPDWWRSSEELDVLREYIQSLLPAAGVRSDNSSPLPENYTQLPLCLPG